MEVSLTTLYITMVQAMKLEATMVMEKQKQRWYNIHTAKTFLMDVCANPQFNLQQYFTFIGLGRRLDKQHSSIFSY